MIVGPSPVFVDVEASGIAQGSFPVEVGWARAHLLPHGAVELVVRSILLRPSERWLERQGAWDPAGQAVHGLALADLLSVGLPPEAACDLLDAALAGAEVCSDTGGAGWDADWLATLYEAAEREPRGWSLGEKVSGGVVAHRFRELGLDPRVARPALARWTPPATHAAAEDALGFAWQWAMAGLLAEADVGTLDPAALRAALDDLPSLVAPTYWPQLAEGGEGGFRRRR